MCGIAGIYKMGDRPIREWQLVMLANSLEYRGTDSTGIALMDLNGQIHIHKHHDQAWRFVKSDSFRAFCDEHLTDDTRIALVHTRKATKGNPVHNANNHPISAGAGCIIHNGMITNDDALFSANSEKVTWKRSCETDSDAIRAMVDTWGGIDKGLIREMNKLSGVAAVAALHPSTPDKLLLLRDSNPLIIGATKDMFMFASDKTALYRALKPWVKVHNIPMQLHAPDICFVPMPNETGWIIGPKGFETHDVFRCNGVVGRGNTKYYHSVDYLEKKAKNLAAATTEAPKVHGPSMPVAPRVTTLQNQADAVHTAHKLPHWVICPKGECSKHLQLNDDERELSGLEFLCCGDCGMNLAGAVPADLVA